MPNLQLLLTTMPKLSYIGKNKKQRYKLLKFCALASGSSGNCICVSHGNTALLVDAGISGKKIEAGLMDAGLSPDSIKAVLVTHDHIDHTQGAAIFARRYNIPIFATRGTLGYIRDHSRAPLPEKLMSPVEPDRSFKIGDIEITPFRTSHDAVDPVAYTLSADGRKLGMATDLGIFDEYTINHLSNCDALYIEANHDVNMLMLGSYPYSLKIRIRSELGHLSNEDCALLIRKVRHENLKSIVLAHISKENNFPELAYETVRLDIEQDTRFESVPKLYIAKRHETSDIITL